MSTNVIAVFKQHKIFINTFICCLNPEAYPTLCACNHHKDHVKSPYSTLFSLHFHSTMDTMKAWTEIGDLLFLVKWHGTNHQNGLLKASRAAMLKSFKNELKMGTNRMSLCEGKQDFY